MKAPGTPSPIGFPEDKVDLVAAFLRGLPSHRTRTAYKQVLVQFATFLDDRDLMATSRREVEAYRAFMEALGRSSATIAKHLAAVSGFFEYAMDEGVIEKNPAARARRPQLTDTSPRKGTSVEEIRELLRVIDISKPVGLRDRALILVLAVQGWRISEVLGLRVENLGEENGHKTAEIVGKGNRVARVPLAGEIWQALVDWTQMAQIKSGSIFVRVDKGGRVKTGKPMSPQGAWKRIVFLGKKAHIGRPLYPHLFRHGAVSEALARGVALHLVQDFARHADPRTTRRYDSHRASLNNPTAPVLAAAVVGDTAGEAIGGTSSATTTAK